MKLFNLPDLGEGLAEAEIVEWLVDTGAEVKADQPLLAVETDKAIVEIPAPYSGRIQRLCAGVGDVVKTGEPLLEYMEETTEAGADRGTVVGEVARSDKKLDEPALPVSRRTGSAIKAVPAVRALAQKLDVDLALVSPSGPGGSVSADDVRRVAKRLEELGPLELLSGARRTMAGRMAQSGAEVVPATLTDSADVDHWSDTTNITVRLVEAIVAACAVEPSLNTWFDAHSIGRRVLKTVDVAIAVDSGDGLFTPVIRDAGSYDPPGLISRLEALKTGIRERSLQPRDMRDYTITLSNFGMIGGRYAMPVVVPPTVAIIGAGRIEAQAVVIDQQIVAHRVMPVSLTFDHRVVTGGEAARFLKALVDCLEK